MRNNSPLLNDKTSITRKINKSTTESTNAKPLVKSAKNFKSKKHNQQNQANTLSSNDVELIVRKKLITTTTTTTMTPIESNNQGCSSSVKEPPELVDDSFSSGKINTSTSCIDFKTSPSINTISGSSNINNTNNDMEVTMQTTIVNQKKANPSSTADAVNSLFQDLKHFGSDHNIILKSSNSNHTILSIENNGSIILPDQVNNGNQTGTIPSKNNSTLTLNNDNFINGNNTQLMSTVKKEQLEYEFRLKPRSGKSKEMLSENGLLDDPTNRCKIGLNQSSLCRRCICCCCSNESTISASSTSQSSSSDGDEDASVHSDHSKLKTKQKRIRKNKESLLGARSSELVGDQELAETKNDLKKDRKNVHKHRFIRFLYISCCCCFHFFRFLRKRDKSASSVKCGKNCKSNDLKHRNQHNSSNKEENNKQNFNAEIQSDLNTDTIQFPPPVSCIRVLRPSNDLTPVRFDSHYNIIQALSAADQISNNPLIAVERCLDPALTNHADETGETNFDYEFQACSY